MGLFWIELTNLHFSEFWTSLPWIHKILASEKFTISQTKAWSFVHHLQWEQEKTIRLVPNDLHCYQVGWEGIRHLLFLMWNYGKDSHIQPGQKDFNTLPCCISPHVLLLRIAMQPTDLSFHTILGVLQKNWSLWELRVHDTGHSAFSIQFYLENRH